MGYKFLVTSPFKRKVFDTINILRKYYQENEIIIVSHVASDNVRRKIELIYGVDINIILPVPKEDNSQLFDRIANYFPKHQIIFIPTEEDDIISFLNYLKVGNKIASYLYVLEDLEKFNSIRNKDLLSKLCKIHQIPHPKIYDSFEEIRKSCPEDHRLVLKPKIGDGARGIRYVEKKELNIKNFEKILNQGYIIQDYVENSGVRGYFALSINGKVLQRYTHKRKLTYPSSGGVSVWSEFNFNEEIMKAGDDVISKLDYSGLIMLEFLFDEKQRQYKLLEANPRIWGSILASEKSGTQLLKNYINVCRNKPIVQQEKVEGNLIWFFPYGFLNLFKINFILKCFHKNTVFVNFTYARIFKAILFKIFVYFPRLLKR